MLFRDGVEAENAAKACGAADFLQGRMELGGRVGHEIKEELIRL